MIKELESAVRAISRAVEGVDLDPKETERAFNDIFDYDREGYHYLAFCTALHTKGETADELLGLCNTSKRGVRIEPSIDSELLTDLSGTGGGLIKTINVSTLASFIIAASGFVVAKQAMFGITSPTGSADIFKEFGIDVFSLDKKVVEGTLEKVGICPLFLSALSPVFSNRSKLARMVYGEKGLSIRSPFNIAAFAYSPTRLTKRVYGCYSEKYLQVLGELFQKLGNKKTLVVHGVGGLPEASNFGKTIVLDQENDTLKSYELDPEDFGVNKSHIDEIRTGGREQNIIDFLRVIYGKERGAKKDLVLVNASLALYTLGKVNKFKEGTEFANNILSSGKASKVLENLIALRGDKEIFKAWLSKAL